MTRHWRHRSWVSQMLQLKRSVSIKVSGLQTICGAIAATSCIVVTCVPVLADTTPLRPECRPGIKAFFEYEDPDHSRTAADAAQQRLLHTWTEDVRRKYGADFADKRLARNIDEGCEKQDKPDLIRCWLFATPCRRGIATRAGDPVAPALRDQRPGTKVIRPNAPQLTR